MANSGTNANQSKTILLVTDTPEDLDHLRTQLGGAGYSLVQAWGMTRALEKVESASPDLVLLDVTTSELQGLEFCKRLRERAETEALPVLVLADAGEGREETIAEVGADSFIFRPFQRVELISRVRSLLRLRDLHVRVTDQNRQLLDVNARLDQLNQELIQRNRELELGMDMAHRMQDALLPQRYPRVPNIGFSHKYTPAEAIGGDLFQITGLEDGRAAITICDVSGHGVRAALVTTIVKAVLDYIDYNDKTPTEVLKDLNSRFRSVLDRLTPQIYATVCVMYVDGENRTIAVADAGHPQPLLVSKKAMSAQPVLDSEQVGTAIGFVSNPDYPTQEHRLAVGDIVLGFTDGIYEVRDEQGQMYGLSRLQELVAHNAHLVPRDLIQRCITETDDFMAGLARPDDVCMVVVEVH